MLGLALAVMCAWGSAGIAPLRDAAAGAVAPSDLPTDFVPAARRWRGEPPGIDVVAGNREAARAGAPRFVELGTPYRAHPPPAVMLVAPLVPLGFAGAALAWLGLSLLSLAALAWIVTGVFVPRGEQRFVRALVVFAVLALWPPVLHNFEKGQWSLPIAALLALAWVAAARGWDRRAGALIAAAGCFKVMPFLLLGAFLPRPSRWRVLAGAAGATGLLFGLSALVLGPGYWRDFIASAGSNSAGWQTAPANTMSLWGALARFVVGGPYARSIAGGSAVLARVLWAASAAGLLAMALRASVKETRAAPEAPPSAGTWASWSALTAILGPLSWAHSATWLILPMALLARQVWHPGRAPTRSRTFVALALAGILMTIPRQSLFALAGPWPASPWRGLALAVHLAGALTVFAVASTATGCQDQGAVP